MMALKNSLSNSTRKWTLQITCTLLVLILVVSPSDSMPHRRERRSVKGECGNSCFMKYLNCNTIATTEAEHRICLFARGFCEAECRVKLL